MDSNSNLTRPSPARFMPWLFFAAAFQSLLPIIALLQIPGKSGLSLARLALIALPAFLFLGWSYLGFAARKTPLSARWILPLWRFSALIFLASGLSLFLLAYLNPAQLLPYWQRLSPLLWYLLATSAELWGFFTLLRFEFQPQALRVESSTRRVTLFAFFSFIALFAFVALTKIGVTADEGYWGEPGVPIVGWQFILSLLIGILLLPTFNLQRSTFNLLLPALIYLAALALWLSVPIEVLKNSYYAPIVPPLEMPLPYSDAGFYDYLSQSLLIGAGYLNAIPPRPLYVAFLASLHALFGQNYAAVIAGQTAALALFPVILYFLGKRLHSAAAGISIALFAIFREWASLVISSNARVANSKIFTTDFPTALALVSLSLVMYGWLKRRDLPTTMLAGGFFGLTLLFRTQSLFILPVVFALAWFAYDRKWKDWFLAGLTFAAAMILVLAPWLTHNYLQTGKFTFDDPKQVAVIYSQYSFDENLNLKSFDPQKDSVGARMLEFSLQNPGFVANFMASHFLNTEIGGLLTLPLIKPYAGLSAPLNLYWLSWDGSLEWYNAALLIFYLAVIAFGLGAAWKRARWLGFIPLAINVGYALANAISRFSSWRYNLPVDWAAYFYFTLGCIEIAALLFTAFGRMTSRAIAESKPAHSPLRARHGILLAGMILVGALPWLAKGVVPPRYTASGEELLRRAAESGLPEEEARAFLSQPNAVLVEGLMLYPRMYRRDEGVTSANPWAAYKARPYPRLSFILLNARRYDMVFPTKEILPFPQGASVTVLACKAQDHYEARVVWVGAEKFQSGDVSAPCPTNP